MARAASSAQQRESVFADHDGIHDQRKGERSAARATAATISADPSAPVLAAAGGMSSSTASICAVTRSGDRTSTRETRCVFCTVIRVITASP